MVADDITLVLGVGLEVIAFGTTGFNIIKQLLFTSGDDGHDFY
jgi:hypothetical protein